MDGGVGVYTTVYVNIDRNIVALYIFVIYIRYIYSLYISMCGRGKGSLPSVKTPSTRV